MSGSAMGMDYLNQDHYSSSNFSIRTLLATGLLLGAFVYPYSVAETVLYSPDVWGVRKEHIAESITGHVRDSTELPTETTVSQGEKEYPARLSYTIRNDLNDYMDSLLERYNPDYAAVVIMEADTGKILSVSSHTRADEPVGNLAMHSGFPAASIFKIVTSAAVINEGKASPDTTYKFNGKSTSLYKKNVLRHKDNKWTRKVPLKQAFASSINTVFGKIGIYHVGGDKLNEYAKIFGFNSPLDGDFIIEPSVTKINEDDEWSIAEAASGFTRATTLSPVHAASIVSTIANNGFTVTPHVVDSAYHENGPLIYSAEYSATRTFPKETVDNMRVLMRATVRRGSARKSFRGFFIEEYAKLDVGGKTGSLTGYDPKGRTEWFAGYGDSGTDKIAISAVVVNKEKWYVKPAYLARKALEKYFESGDSAKG